MALASATDLAETPQLAALERGDIAFLPRAGFETGPHERLLLSPDVCDGRAKNLSYEPSTGQVRGSSLDPAGQALAAALLGRFADWAAELVVRPAVRRSRLGTSGARADQGPPHPL